MSKSVYLEPIHKELGAKFTDFNGWNMPLHYSSGKEEHLAVRKKAGIFDVSHMGQIFVEGDEAKDFVESVFSNSLASADIGDAVYGLLTNFEGGVVDDVIVYILAPERIFVCVNAGNRETARDWLIERSADFSGVTIDDQSESYVQFAISGPEAVELCVKTLRDDFDLSGLENVGRFTHRTFDNQDAGIIVARTGYTGEDGFEIFLKQGQLAEDIFRRFLDLGVCPCGLSSRDTLRLEAGYPLYGHELRANIPATCCGVLFAIKLNKGEFVGRSALAKIEPQHKLVGLKVNGRGIARDEMKVFAEGREIGWISSGTKTPSLDYPIAMAFVERAQGKVGTILEVDVRGRPVEVEVVKRPFV